MKKSIFLITAVLAIAFTATHAFSWGQGRGEPGQGMAFGQKAWTDLSKEQRDELTALRQKFIDDTYELRSAVMLKKNQARMLMETSNPDREALIKLSREANDLKNRIMEKRIDFALAAKKVAPELNLGWGNGRGSRNGCGGKGGRGFGSCRGQSGNCPRY